MVQTLKIQIIDADLCVVRLDPSDILPEKVWGSSFLSVTRTDEETSIVCEKSYCPESGRRESGYGLIKIVGPLDFSLTGILNTLLEPLATAEISVFTISTYDTDFILIKNDQLALAAKILGDLPDVEIAQPTQSPGA